MDTFLRTAGIVLVSVVLSLTVGSQNKQFSTLLSIGVCVMVLIMAASYLEPVVSFLEELKSLANLRGDYVRILMKVTLIGIITEISALLCSDGGNGSLAHSLRMVSACVILWLSIPVFRGLLELLQRILEGV